VKVAFVISGKSPRDMSGGLGTYAYNVARAMRDIGFRVYIIGFSDRDEVVDTGFATLIHFRNPYSRLLGLGAVLSASRFVKIMEEVLERESPRISSCIAPGSGGSPAAGSRNG